MAISYTTKVTETLDRGKLVLRGYDVTGVNKGTLMNLFVTQKVKGLSPDPRIVTTEIFCPGVDLSEFLTSFPTDLTPSTEQDIGNETRREIKAMGLTGTPDGVLVSSRTISKVRDGKVLVDLITSVELTFIPNAVISGGDIVSS